ncbi:unnamed protein product [Musa textilis]
MSSKRSSTIFLQDRSQEAPPVFATAGRRRPHGPPILLDNVRA